MPLVVFAEAGVPLGTDHARRRLTAQPCLLDFGAVRQGAAHWRDGYFSVLWRHWARHRLCPAFRMSLYRPCSNADDRNPGCAFAQGNMADHDFRRCWQKGLTISSSSRPSIVRRSPSFCALPSYGVNSSAMKSGTNIVLPCDVLLQVLIYAGVASGGNCRSPKNG